MGRTEASISVKGQTPSKPAQLPTVPLNAERHSLCPCREWARDTPVGTTGCAPLGNWLLLPLLLLSERMLCFLSFVSLVSDSKTWAGASDILSSVCRGRCGDGGGGRLRRLENSFLEREAGSVGHQPSWNGEFPRGGIRGFRSRAANQIECPVLGSLGGPSNANNPCVHQQNENGSSHHLTPLSINLSSIEKLRHHRFASEDFVRCYNSLLLGTLETTLRVLALRVYLSHWSQPAFPGSTALKIGHFWVA